MVTTTVHNLTLTIAPRGIDLEHVDALPALSTVAKHAAAVIRPRARGALDDDGDGLPLPAVAKAEVAAAKAKKSGVTDEAVITPPPPPIKTVTILPPPEVEAAKPTTFAQLQTYKQLIQGYTWARALQKLYREDPEKYKSSKIEDMVQTTGKLARHLFNQYQKGLGAILPATKIAERTFSKRCRMFELHDELLSELFKGFMLPAGELKQLDNMLNSFMKSLKGIDLKYTNETVADSQALCVVAYAPVLLSAKDSEGNVLTNTPPDQQIWEMTCRCFLFELGQDTRHIAVRVGKDTASYDEIDFKMSWLDFNGTVNNAIMEDYKDWLKLKQEEITSQVTKYLDDTKSSNEKVVRSKQVLNREQSDDA